jgi:preprotein translocase subunit YajC
VTQGGIIGKVTATEDRVITLEVGRDTRIRVLRSHILGPESMLEARDGKSVSGDK